MPEAKIIGSVRLTITVPKQLHQLFKASCSLTGRSMRKAIISYMRAEIKSLKPKERT
jgi:hypothetical protein